MDGIRVRLGDACIVELGGVMTVVPVGVKLPGVRLSVISTVSAGVEVLGAGISVVSTVSGSVEEEAVKNAPGLSDGVRETAMRRLSDGVKEIDMSPPSEEVGSVILGSTLSATLAEGVAIIVGKLVDTACQVACRV